MKDTVEMVFMQTCEMAGRIAASRDCTVKHAAREAREIMADLLSLESLRFDLMKTPDDFVAGIGISYEV